ncbi:unannotated protein [freshwater metagenome]|uniref:Unannotated protein n=1 Tax=freshwater metagenome TaxID=449393 RepID=A0A6J7PXC9_9ZZZZ
MHGVPGRTNWAIATPARVSATSSDRPAASVTGAEVPAKRKGVMATGCPYSAHATRVSTMRPSHTRGLLGFTMPMAMGLASSASRPPAAMAASSNASRDLPPLVP